MRVRSSDLASLTVGRAVPEDVQSCSARRSLPLYRHHWMRSVSAPLSLKLSLGIRETRGRVHKYYRCSACSTPLTSPHHIRPIGDMARSHIPKPTRTDSFYLGHNPQHDIRSALELPPRAFHSQFDDAPIDANREFEYEDGSLTRAWDQVRFGRGRSNGN